jgi:hypothetical protein
MGSHKAVLDVVIVILIFHTNQSIHPRHPDIDKCNIVSINPEIRKPFWKSLSELTSNPSCSKICSKINAMSDSSSTNRILHLNFGVLIGGLISSVRS